jgi:hypothetical protein
MGAEVRARRAAFVGTLAVLLSSGCATQLLLTRDQLWAVAGLPTGGLRTVYTNHGPYTFNGDIEVSVGTSSGALPRTPLKKIKHAGANLIVEAPGRPPMQLGRQDVVNAEASVFSASRSIELAGGLAAAAAFIYIAVIGLLLL